jgi:vesicular inhibitory amino acid transporter
MKFADRRVQYFATSNVPLTSPNSDPQDEESGDLRSDESPLVDSEIEPGDCTPVPQDGIIGQFDWDDMLPESSEQDAVFFSRREAPYLSRLKQSQSPTLRSGENTPLLRKAVSFSDAVHPQRLPSVDKVSAEQKSSTAASGQTDYQAVGLAKVSLPHRSSTKTVRHIYGGKSTYGQTVGIFQYPFPLYIDAFLYSYSIQ